MLPGHIRVTQIISGKATSVDVISMTDTVGGWSMNKVRCFLNSVMDWYRFRE